MCTTDGKTFATRVTTAAGATGARMSSTAGRCLRPSRRSSRPRRNLDGVRGKLHIGCEVGGRAELLEQLKRKVEEACPDDEERDVRLPKPAANAPDRLRHAHRLAEDPSMGADPDEAEQCHRRESNLAVSIQQVLPPAARAW